MSSTAVNEPLNAHAHRLHTPLPPDHPPVRPHIHTASCPVVGEHDYCPPQEDDCRSPCPALNTMANHGYIPRNGKNLSPFTIINGLKKCYGLSAPLAYVLSIGGFLLLHKFNFLFTKLTLYEIGRHNMVEHDASLVHRDTPEGEKFAPVDIIKEWVDDLCRDALPLEDAMVSDEGEPTDEEKRASPSGEFQNPIPEEDKDDSNNNILLDRPRTASPTRESSPAHSRSPSLIPSPTSATFTISSKSSAATPTSSRFSSFSRFSLSRSTAATTPATSPASSPTASKFPSLSFRLGSKMAAAAVAQNEASSTQATTEVEVIQSDDSKNGANHTQNDDLHDNDISNQTNVPSPRIPNAKSVLVVMSADDVGRARIRRERETYMAWKKRGAQVAARDANEKKSRSMLKKNRSKIKEQKTKDGRVIETTLDALHAEIARGEMAIALGMFKTTVSLDQSDASSSSTTSSSQSPTPSTPSSQSSPASSTSDVRSKEGIPLPWLREWITYERLPEGGKWRPDHVQGLRDTVNRSKQIRTWMNQVRATQ